DLAAHFSRRDADQRGGPRQTGAAQRGGREHSQHRPQRRLPRGGRGRTGAYGTPAARRPRRVRQIGEAADRGRDRRVDMSSDERQILRTGSIIRNDERGMRNEKKSAIANPQSAISSQSLEMHI